MTSPRNLTAATRAALSVAVAAFTVVPLGFLAVSPAVAQPAPEPPAIVVDPAEIVAVQGPDEVVFHPLAIGNLGGADLDWQLTTDPDPHPRLPIHPTTPMQPVAQEPGGSAALAGFPGHRGRPGWTTPVDLPPPAPDHRTLTHASVPEIVAGSAVACSPDRGVRTTANGYLRHFTLADYGIVGDLAVTAVSFGVESMQGGTAPVTVNLYTLVDPAGPFVYANFAPLGTAAVNVASQRMSLVEVPVSGTVPAGATLVVEVSVPELARGGLYLGAHSGSQTAASYLRAEACGLPEPAPTDQIGAPDLQLLLTVTGEAALVDCGLPAELPWLSADPVAGTVPGGDGEVVSVALDSAGMTGGDAHQTSLCLASNDPTRPRVEVPVSLQVQATPEITVTPEEFAIVQRAGEVSDQTLTIGNVGDGSLEWTVTATGPGCDDPAEVPWLAVAPGQGSTPPAGQSEVVVTFDTTDQVEGEHTGWICVQSNDPHRPVSALPVTLTVFGPACDRTIDGVHPGPLTVTDGVTCLAPGAQVQGEVNVLAGAGLVATSAVVQGPLATFDATVVELTSSQVVGPAAIRGTTDRITVTGTQVVGSVLVINNRTSAGPPVISANTVIGSLFCTGNQPPPVDVGAPNTVVGGMKLDQCAGL